ncbi:endonuclease [Dyadobacter sp. CY326]|uniref:endonuclease n=1 Tax=Dyadobacter sp. CY326 TaxID=2907300 RepID=UPI001F38E5CB|nr:endonuclease [Dyadobacter sp. CY326]MCE7067080.1 endonuclease [Dyadobacter sp. CY326]
MHITVAMLGLVFMMSCSNSEHISQALPAGVERINFTNSTYPRQEGQFTMVTYNIAGLPAIISSAQTERPSSISEIGQRLNRFEIVHVQEDFNYHNQLVSDGNNHLFKSSPKGRIPFGDGLNTLSNYPIHDLTRIPWDDCAGADCLTPKGFTYSKIEVAPHVFVDFYNVHANAYNNLRAAAARRRNMEQLSNYIAAHSGKNAVIVMGDLNGHYSYAYDNIQLLNTRNGLQDVWVDKVCKSNYPVQSDQEPMSNILSLGEMNETIDKILYRSSETIELTPLSYHFENQIFNDAQGRPLSDHHPVSARFEWRMAPDCCQDGRE